MLNRIEIKLNNESDFLRKIDLDNFLKEYDFCIDDFDVNFTKEQRHFIFCNIFDSVIRSDINQWGSCDTLVRENIFKYLIKYIYNCTIEEYYDNIFDIDNMAKNIEFELEVDEDNLNDDYESNGINIDAIRCYLKR